MNGHLGNDQQWIKSSLGETILCRSRIPFTLAKTMKITRQQLHNVMTRRSAVTPVMALRFEKAFGGSADMWLRMQAAYDLAQARKHLGEMNIPRLVEQPSL